MSVGNHLLFDASVLCVNPVCSPHSVSFHSSETMKDWFYLHWKHRNGLNEPRLAEANESACCNEKLTRSETAQLSPL